jgi:2-polyprenyl-3-methyl-5-hydroxy-6-metoxy-1,4-benzoquinol methylase
MTNPTRSPLTFSNNVVEAGKIKSDEIIAIYAKHFKLNIESYFKNVPEVKIFKCLDTKYMFYYPFTLEGDENYYGLMSKFDWYYNPSRWEHGKAIEIINEKDNVLEIGAGSGSFLKKLKEKAPFVTGLELNTKAIEEAKSIGVELHKELIQDHARKNANKYDVVCSFQVLEHISQPHEFIAAQLQSLKPNGKMIIGVPNNDSYLKDNKLPSKVLNMPPHHMGLWTPASLKSLENIFNITLMDIYYEPLVGANVDTYLWNSVNNFFFGFSLFTRAIWKFKIHNTLRFFLLKRAHKIKGNSMIAIFEKNG